MILYKYMSFAAARQVMAEPSVGFSCLEDLNDPFECTSFGFEEIGDAIITKMASKACKNKFSRNYGVLSLTRQPLNPLMWSHYGDSHKGVVVGFDVDQAGLSDIGSCVIPGQYGEVIYTSTKPHKDLPIISIEELEEIGEGVRFDPDTYNLVKRAFLYKSLEWGYEEEVRVVKNISDIPFGYHFSEGRHEEWRKINVNGRPLYLFDISRSSIREVYLGKDIYKNVSKYNLLTGDELTNLIQLWMKQGVSLMRCEVDINSWGLIPQKIDHLEGDK